MRVVERRVGARAHEFLDADVDRRVARIVLKIDVDTLRGTREGVPNLARMLDRFKARATFLFSLGPDHTGWALRRVLRSAVDQG